VIGAPRSSAESPETPESSGAILPRKVTATSNLGVISVFSALIAISTILVIPLPPPLAELTWSPPIYMALSVLAGPWPAFFSTAIGSFLGEFTNVAINGFPPIYAPGIVWARAPEALIIGWARNKAPRTIALAMVAATVFETLAFFFPDWFFYAFGLFGYGTNNTGLTSGFYAAALDFGTLVDLFYIPVAFAIIRGAAPAFKRLGFQKGGSSPLTQAEGIVR
jgi:ECF-type riboflavin transporter S component